jgi:hypothetical protein
MYLRPPFAHEKGLIDMATNHYPVEDGSTRTGHGVNVRVFIYVIGLHVFAGFAMLLFFLSQRGQ